MKWQLILILFVIFSINLVNALDSSIPLSCGGNSDVLIGCLDSESLIFLGKIVPTEAGGQSGGVEIPEVEPEIIYVPKEPELPFFSIANINKFLMNKGLSQLDIYILEIFVFGIFICLLIFWKRDKEKKVEKKIDKKDKYEPF